MCSYYTITDLFFLHADTKNTLIFLSEIQVYLFDLLIAARSLDFQLVIKIVRIIKEL